MVNLAAQSRHDFYIRNRALQIVQDVREKDWLGEIRAIHEYVRDNIRYVRDIHGVETIATPAKTLQMMQGDCDDKSLLVASLLEAVGHPARFVAVGRSPGDYEHVLVETRVGSRWIPVETTEPVPLGWYPAGMSQRLVYHI
jgi:transglutaminase-like putative cysteine protease